MEPIAACLALEDRLGWRMNDKYLVRGGGASSSGATLCVLEEACTWIQRRSFTTNPKLRLVCRDRLCCLASVRLVVTNPFQ